MTSAGWFFDHRARDAGGLVWTSSPHFKALFHELFDVESRGFPAPAFFASIASMAGRCVPRQGCPETDIRSSIAGAPAVCGFGERAAMCGSFSISNRAPCHTTSVARRQGKDPARQTESVTV